MQTTVASLTKHGLVGGVGTGSTYQYQHRQQVSTDQDGFVLRAEVPGEIMAQVRPM